VLRRLLNALRCGAKTVQNSVLMIDYLRPSLRTPGTVSSSEKCVPQKPDFIGGSSKRQTASCIQLISSNDLVKARRFFV